MSVDFRCSDVSTSIDASLTMVMGAFLSPAFLSSGPCLLCTAARLPNCVMFVIYRAGECHTYFAAMCFCSSIDACALSAGDDMVKVVAWYDNEWGYSQRVVDLAELTAAKGNF